MNVRDLMFFFFCIQIVADSFNNGLEYFNTFGGNPVCAAAALAVLKTIEEEGLQASCQFCAAKRGKVHLLWKVHAAKTGEYLRASLWKLAKKHPLVAQALELGALSSSVALYHIFHSDRLGMFVGKDFLLASNS